jgi:hypothetical protein
MANARITYLGFSEGGSLSAALWGHKMTFWHRATVRWLAMALFLLAGVPAANAHIILLERSVLNSLTDPTVVLTGGGAANFSFTIPPPPIPGPIISHGEEHYYFDTALVSVQFWTLGGDSKTMATPRDLGPITAPKLINQGFLMADLIALLGANSEIVFATADLVDKYQPVPPPVPEPASWALLIGGFAMAGAMLRRRARPAVAMR